MARSNTVWGARHKEEEQEIERLREEYSRRFKIRLTKLEASAVLARRSKSTSFPANELKKMIEEMRTYG